MRLRNVLLATSNEGKRRELQDLLLGSSIEIISLSSLEKLPEAVEDGLTFAENARKKAQHFFDLTGIPTIADDSGLEVDALGGEPGIYSARYASTNPERIKKLLRSLKQLEPSPSGEQRSARFVCAVCAILDSEQIVEVEASVEGLITTLPKGESGFGYDPIFYYPAFGKTFAEVSPAEKNQVSHRGRALRKLKAELESRKV